MALRSGYYGLKNATKKALEKLAADTVGMKIIKTIGDGLNLTNAGKLNMTAATANKLGGIKVGDGLSIDDGVLSAQGGITIKTLSYTGDGTTTSTIDFSNEDSEPSYILGITGQSHDNYYMNCAPFPIEYEGVYVTYVPVSGTGAPGGASGHASYSDKVLHVTSNSADNAMNYNGTEYTVYYI